MIDVVMPQMGESIVEGTLTKWTKKVGEKIERDEPLFEISTDKVDTEIPAPASGTLAEILVQEGQTVGINTVVAQNRRERWRSAAPSPAGCGGSLHLLRRLACAGRGAQHRACQKARSRLLPPRLSRRTPRARGSAVTAGPQNGPREQYRPGTGEGHRRRWTHHQAGRGSLPGQSRSLQFRPRLHRTAPPPPAPAASAPLAKFSHLSRHPRRPKCASSP